MSYFYINYYINNKVLKMMVVFELCNNCNVPTELLRPFIKKYINQSKTGWQCQMTYVRPL